MRGQITKKESVRRNRTFRFSEYELQKLAQGAEKTGMNESRYVRELILHSCVDSTNAEDRRNLIRQISGIATNVNQMAKRCNESEWINSADVICLRRMLEEITKLLQELFRKWR